MDSLTYEMRKLAIEGRVFYQNELTEPENVKTYFPPTEGEKNYNRRPKLSFPVTGEIVDRLSSFVYSGMRVVWDNPSDESVWNEIADRNDFLDQARSMVVQPLARGNQLTTIHNVGGVVWENWGGEFTHHTKSAFYDAAGYEYYAEENGPIKPVTSGSKKRPKNLVTMTIDDTFFIYQQGEQEPIVSMHGLPFAPFVFCKAVDVDSSKRYAFPYYLRFRDLLIEYNLIRSQISKAIRILQTVWETNKDLDNPNFPLRIDPDAINHVGKDGFLRQVVRELRIEPELAQCEALKQHISTRAQVPDFMTGLNGVGKVESGVALSIVSGPLAEICDRIRPTFKANVTSLISKSMQVEYQARGIRKANISFSVELSESVIPQDVQIEIDTAIKANQAGLIPPALLPALQMKVAALLNLKEAAA